MASQAKMTQAHEERGKVERMVQSIRRIIEEKQLLQFKQSVISWETSLAAVANCINNLPLARGPGSSQTERGEYDVITRNRLLCGRNNERAIEGNFNVAGDPNKQIARLREINEYFYKNLMRNIFEIVPMTTWRRSTRACEANDLVLFICKESPMNETWRLGIVHQIISEPDMPMQVKVRYKLAAENTFRFTPRSVRELVVIHRVDESDYNTTDHLWELQTERNRAAEIHLIKK